MVKVSGRFEFRSMLQRVAWFRYRAWGWDLTAESCCAGDSEVWVPSGAWLVCSLSGILAKLQAQTPQL